jgi:glycosyltransferase involved in cell wall biosynthesis
LACGFPAVITDFGDNSSWVQDGQNGYLFPVGDSSALADRIISLLGDTALRKRCGKLNASVILERNNYYKEMASVEQLYYESINIGKPCS